MANASKNVPPMQETIDSAHAAASTLFLGHDGEWWDFWLIMSVIFAALAAIAIGVATTGSIVSHKREAASAEEALGRYKLETEGKIKSAEAVGETAKQETAKATVQIASANERAAALEKEAEEARLQTEKLKGAVAWRNLPQERANFLQGALSTKEGSVNLRYVDGDPESLFFAIQFSQILSRAGWKVAPGAVKPNNGLFFGVGLPDEKGDAAETLRKAFTLTGIQFSTEQVPVSIGFNISVIPDAPTLLIGSRRPPAVE